MENLKDIALVLHFLGLAALIGGFLVQMRSEHKRIDAAMLHGALTQLFTGIALVGLNEAIPGEVVDYPKIGVKLVVLLVITVLVLRHRQERSVSTGVWAAIGGLTVLNVVVAVVW